MRERPLVSVIGLSVVIAASGCSANDGGTARSILKCAGVFARVPEGWQGRVRPGLGGFVTVTLASFPLVAEADDVDEQSAKQMSGPDVLVLLLGYGSGQANDPAFKGHVRLPLAVQRMTVYRMFEHLPRGHRLARARFVASGGAYEAQVQFARPLTSFLLSKANMALRLLRFSPSPPQPPRTRTRC